MRSTFSLASGLLVAFVVFQGPAFAADNAKTDSLARRYNVDSQVVQELRDKNRGWGEISHELALAQRLSKEQPETYTSIQTALNQIETMREEGKGWGAISKELGQKHGRVVSDDRRSAKESSNPGRNFEKSARSQRPEKMGGHANRK